uniref:Maestro heat-like repeat family member 1 n=1 Tax=Gouania willdenowi TaxID=441366 RepID=A0A8C5DAF3_GOUWI
KMFVYKANITRPLLVSVCDALAVGHRVVILQTIELIVSCRIEEIDTPKIKGVISLASEEMTRSKEVVPDWQQAASNILVAIGNKHINDIMEEILNKFQPGVLPHFFVVQTLASLSDSNVYGMVPFLNAILGTMLPMLSMAKHDNMKWCLFKCSLRHFSNSILEYLANLDKAPDPTVRKDTFSSEIYTAYDTIFNNWLQSREPKLRLTVAEAVGSMCHLIASDKLEEQIPKVIPAIVSLYKKNHEHFIISKSLCQILEASINVGSRVLETQLDTLLLALHQQVCAPVDYSDPPTVKNHNEVLRCFSVLAIAFPDRLVMYVLQKLENSNERSRTGSLSVLRHLINSTTSTMESKKLLILTSIRQPMADHSNKVKKRVVQVISAMAHHGYLELEGGEILVRFIVQHCALPDTNQGQKPTDPEGVTNESLREMCDSALHLLTTTVGQLVLWPKLLYYLTPSQYSNATTPLCKSLIVLGTKKRKNQEASFNINFKQEGRWNINKQCPIRCVKSFPYSCRHHGAPSLSLLQTLSINIHPKAEIFWENEIPPLLSLLEGIVNTKIRFSFIQSTIPNLGFQGFFCSDSLHKEAFNNDVQLTIVFNRVHNRNFLYRCIGATLQQCFNKEVVKKQLQEVLLTARHADAVERQGVAMGIGLCANSHLEGTLAKLEEFGKSEVFKKSPSIFNLLKERNDVEVEKVKSTLILSYGQVAFNAPPEKLLNRIDQDILRSISKHFNTKVLKLQSRNHLIQSVGLIAKAISNCVKKQTFTFSRKQELITVMLDFIKAEPNDSLRSPVRHLVMTTCAESVSCLSTVFNVLCVCCISSQHIESWLSSPQDHERERAVTVTAHILAYYLDNLTSMVFFHNLGALLGRLSPRCSDPHPPVRTAAIDCVYTLLYTQLRYEGFSLDYKDEAVESLLPLKEQLENPDHSVLYKTCSDMTKRLPQQQMTTLVFMLFEGLVDSQTNCCRASSVILNTLLKSRGAGLQDKVPEMMEMLHVRLQSITEEQVSALHEHVVLMANLCNTAIEQKKMRLVKESMMRGGSTKVATNHPLAVRYRSFTAWVNTLSPAVKCISLRCQSCASRGNAGKSPPCYCYRVAADALRILLARAQLDEVMKRLDEDNAWDAMRELSSHITGVTLLARAIAKHAGPRLPAIVESLCPSLNNIYECHRITVTAFFSELLNHHVVTELMLIDVLMNNMMERISDSCCTVRMLAVRGLGNIAEGSPEKVNKYAKELLAAMSSGMEEKDDPGKFITLEAMSGLSKVLLYLDKKNVHLLVVYIFMKIKPFLESENDDIRCASIRLMGNLSKFGSGEPVFKDQIHNVLVSLLLHLVDPNPEVVKACKYAMRVCAPVVGSEQITTMFQTHLHEDKNLHYGEFINDLTKYLIQDFPSMLNFYHISVIQFFKSNWPEVRAGAAMFIGTLSAVDHQCVSAK